MLPTSHNRLFTIAILMIQHLIQHHLLSYHRPGIPSRESVCAHHLNAYLCLLLFDGVSTVEIEAINEDTAKPSQNTQTNLRRRYSR